VHVQPPLPPTPKTAFFHMEKFNTIWNIRVQGIKKKERMQVKHHISDFAYHPSFRNVSREKLHYCCMLSACYFSIGIDYNIVNIEVPNCAYGAKIEST
jgi:hypothetical protein